MIAYKSKDLETWDEAGYVYHMPEGYKCPDDWWAPDTYYYNGKYYCFVTVSGSANGILRGTTVLRSDNGPLGPYKNIIPDDRIFITPPGMQCLDASLYVDKDGEPWMFFSVEWNGPNVVDCVGEIWCQRLNHELNGTVGDVWYEKERLNMEEHLSTNTSDPISVIKDYIRSHLSDPELGRTSIAEEIHMNPDYLSHIFSTKAGASLSSYIMDERMAAAKRLLATTGFSPQQICDQIGIANVSYFYRQFKKSSGVTPQQYRERHFHG